MNIEIIEKIVLARHKDCLTSAVFSPDGNRVLTASHDHTAKLWDTYTGQLLFSLAGHTHWVNSAVFLPCGKRLFTTSYDDTAKIWDIQTGQLLLTFQPTANENLLGTVSSDSLFAFSSTNNYDVNLWDIKTSKLLLTLKGHQGDVNLAKMSANNLFVLTVSRNDDSVRVWDVKNGKQIFILRRHNGYADFCPDNNKIIVFTDEYEAEIFDINQNRRYSSFYEESISSVSFSHNGQYIATAGEYKATISDMKGNLIHTLVEHTNDVRSALFSPDDKLLITTSKDWTAKIWDVENGKLLLSLDDHRNNLEPTAISFDGSCILLPSGDYDDYTATIYKLKIS